MRLFSGYSHNIWLLIIASALFTGAYLGMTLYEAIETYGEALLGSDIMERFGTRFPLIIKFLDASNVLGEQIHLEDDFDCKTSHVIVERGANTQTFIFACRHFAMERLDLREDHALDLDGKRFYVLSQIEGSSRVVAGESVEMLRAGNSCLLPAALESVRLEPQGNAALLKMYVPDLMANIVEPLRARGVSDADIVGLGGHTGLNDLGYSVCR
ncbi:MAG: hypothetical protein U9R48_05260 [Chloroflexota bacterium]|nr:hypothetical protein [Chloroflexota bacterium]